MRARILTVVLVLGALEVAGFVAGVVDAPVPRADARRRRRPVKTKAPEPEPPAPETAGPETAAPPVPENPFEGGTGATAAPAVGATAMPGTSTGTGTGATATAAPQEAPPAVPEPTPHEDLSGIEDEYNRIVDEIFQARTRVAALGAQLYSTKVRIRVQDRTTREQSLQSIRLTLDGDPVFSGDSSFRAEDGRQVYDGFAAPGAHALGVEVELRSRENDRYVYRLRDSFTFEVIKGKLTEVRVLLEEDSNIAEDFPDDREGEYDVRTRVRVEAME